VGELFAPAFLFAVNWGVRRRGGVPLLIGSG